MLAVNAPLTETQLDEKEIRFTKFVKDELGDRQPWMVTVGDVQTLLASAGQELNGDAADFRRWYAAQDGFSIQVREVIDPLYFVVDQIGDEPPSLPDGVEVALVANKSTLFATSYWSAHLAVGRTRRRFCTAGWTTRILGRRIPAIAFYWL